MKLNTSKLIRGLRLINSGLSAAERLEWAVRLRQQRQRDNRRKVASCYMSGLYSS